MKDQTTAGFSAQGEPSYQDPGENALPAGYTGRAGVVLPRGTVAKLREGDHTAFEIVFHTFYSRVRSFIRLIVKSGDLAEDLAQGVFVGLWTGREKLDPDKNLNAYIYTMARNSAISALRRQARFDIQEPGLWEQESGRFTDDELIARETDLLVRVTVAAMPAKRRQVYRMSRFEEMSNEEIAKELNISKKVVEKHLRLAVSELREVVKLMLIFFH